MAQREEYRVEGLAEPISHYTDAVRFGDLVYISGCAPADEKWDPVGGDDPEAQTRQVLGNLSQILDAIGARAADVLKVTVYLTDIDDRSAVNVARSEFFGSSRPASTLVEVSRLADPRWKVEIDAVVGLPS